MRLVVHDPMNWLAGFGHSCCAPMEGVGESDTNQACLHVRMDIVETPEAFKISAELPGMEKDAIKVTVHDDTLTISGERNQAEATDRNVVWGERHWGSFSRSFRLPDTVDKSSVSADFKNGVLEVTVTKKEEQKPQEIEVKIN
ncbi:MAG: Hsp20/alpha crystallin family protein [candidate division Zixibacteria bacterium]|nr:Hsp20/alpha crystallin family protein [candidate division Zixibacteria bacterium]